MLQARMRGAKEWYRPDRDFLLSHPRMVSSALTAVTEALEEEHKTCTDEVRADDLQRLCTVATEMAKIHNACGDRAISKEQLKERLLDLETKYPYMTLQVAIHMLRVSFEMYRHWKLETLPDKPDGTIDHTRLVIPVEVQPDPPKEPAVGV